MSNPLTLAGVYPGIRCRNYPMMFANTMIPEAHSHGGKLAGLFTVLGIVVSVVVVLQESLMVMMRKISKVNNFAYLIKGYLLCV
jgi:hypothetical protein